MLYHGQGYDGIRVKHAVDLGRKFVPWEDFGCSFLPKRSGYRNG